MKDYYEVLRVHPNVSQEEVKESYRRLAHKYHPDMEGGDSTRFKEVLEAFEVIGDPYKRGAYDTKSISPQVVYEQPKPVKKESGFTAGWAFFLIICVAVLFLIITNL